MSVVREGVDFAFGREPDTAMVVMFRKLGKSFVVRYLSHDSTKSLSPDEVNLYRQTGLEFSVVFEDTAGRALAGEAAGRFDAAYVADAVRFVGGPEDAPVYFAVDFPASEDVMAGVTDYINGACRVLGGGRVGVYGSYDVVRTCQRDTLARYYWQTYAWSGGRWASGVQLQQYKNGVSFDGVAVDLDRAMADDFGQWKWEEMSVSDKQEILNALTTLGHKVDQVYRILEDGNSFSKGHVGLRDIRSDITRLGEVVADISRDIVHLQTGADTSHLTGSLEMIGRAAGVTYDPGQHVRSTKEIVDNITALGESSV